MVYLLAVSMWFQAVPDAFMARGPGGGGALFAPSFGPNQELTVACDMSELFRSTNLGHSWDLVPHSQVQANRSSAVRFSGSTRTVIDHTDPSSEGRRRLLRSLDGLQWLPLTDPTDGDPFDLFVDPSNAQALIVTSWNSLYRSLDGGTSWKLAWTGRNSESGLRLAGAFWDGADVYLGTNDGLLVSHDHGSTFGLQSVAGIPPHQQIVALAGGRSGAQVRITAATADSIDVFNGLLVEDLKGSQNRGLWTWTPGGTWTASLGIDPSDQLYLVAQATGSIDTMYAAGSHEQSDWPAIYGSVDGGLHWKSLLQAKGNLNIATGWAGTGGDRDWSYGGMACGLAVAADGRTIAYTDYGFVHVSDDGGQTWRQAYLDPRDQNPVGKNGVAGRSYRSAGLENTTAWSLAWVDSTNLFAGFSDIRAIRSSDAGNSWGFGYAGHPDNSMYRVIASRTGILYAATSTVHDLYQSTRLANSPLDNGKGNILTSADAGKTWRSLWAGPGVVWVELDPTDANTLYASVVHSTQGGVIVTHDLTSTKPTWTSLSKPSGTEGHPFTLTVLPDGSLISSWSGHRNPDFTASSGVFRYLPATKTWKDLSDPGMRYWTKDLVVDPADPANTWWVAVFSGWGGAANGLGGLYRTTDAGAHWTRVWDGDRVESVGIPPNATEIYVTTETQGLWHADDRTLPKPTFSAVASYPFRQPVRVFFNPFDPAEMWVANFGNSLRVGRRDNRSIGVLNATHPSRPAAYWRHRRLEIHGLSGPQEVRFLSLRGEELGSAMALPNRDGIAEIQTTLPKGILVVQIRNYSNQLAFQAGN